MTYNCILSQVLLLTYSLWSEHLLQNRVVGTAWPIRLRLASFRYFASFRVALLCSASLRRCRPVVPLRSCFPISSCGARRIDNEPCILEFFVTPLDHAIFYLVLFFSDCNILRPHSATWLNPSTHARALISSNGSMWVDASGGDFVYSRQVNLCTYICSI